MKKLNLAIIGQGRSGNQIHAAFYHTNKNVYFNVCYVVDKDERRRKDAEKEFPNAKVFPSYKELLKHKDIDLVVNASYSFQHYTITKDLLRHGFNVLCEKPFCRNEKECKDLIKIAKEKKVVLAVFQNTFYAPFYQHALEILKKKKIGEVLQINIQYNGFSRRWDWQTLQKMMGGNSYNTGPHPFGMALGFLEFDPKAKLVYSNLKHTDMSLGDYDDFVKVILSAPNRPVVDVEIDNSDAFSPFNVKFIGTRGTFRCNPFEYEMKYILPGENEKYKPLDFTLVNDKGVPCYCSENLKFHEEKNKYVGTAFDVGTEMIYRDVYNAITKKKELYVTNLMACKITNLIDTIHKANPIKRKF